MHSFDMINRGNAEYVERLYQLYQSNPRSVDASWQAFFAGFELAGGNRDVLTAGAASGPVEGAENATLAMEAADLVHSYRELGHFIAHVDPLGHHRASLPLLDLSEFGFSLGDLDRKVGTGGFQGPTDGTLRDLIERLRSTYCGNIGVEFLDISDKAQREWLLSRMEPILNTPSVRPEEDNWLLNQVVEAQGFEEFLATKYVNYKRFGLEGGEALIPMLNCLVDQAAALGGEEMVFGMAHRGRLNVLANVMNKPYEAILSEFEGKIVLEHEGDGDVKYHLGYSTDRTASNGKRIHLALSFNPSHLELVNPVVEGIVRAKQYYLGDNERSRVIPVLIHGDAAFCGQGIVQECLALSEMPYWRTGGTIHIIINNQIGFTTMPKQGRFTPYPTDVAKMIQAPIFHVNGDDLEAVLHATKLAMAFRQQFHCDVFIDMWCYRRNGHNESDEPGYTQPVMYREIKAHPTLRDIYSKKLIEQNRAAQGDLDQKMADIRAKLDKALASAREHPARPAMTMFGGVWRGMQWAGTDWSAKTAVAADVLKRVGESVGRLPDDFTVNPKLKKLVQARSDMGLGKQPIDWGGAEMLALGSLVLEGTPVRFVGQDAQRGTFSHRHACLHDFESGKKYYPLANLSKEQSPIIFVNTMLSELAVLGFEYGFSSADPRNLVIWEAQFGDFVNGAQPIIDQFIVAAESKWQKMCGLVLLLPHGYEGAGPEHSYAYLDRFLASCADDNIQVCVPTLPGQYFHLLRRQIKRGFRKPLILMMPKSLLRDDRSTSKLDELTQSTFQLVIDDPANLPRDEVKRVLLCSGKVYFALESAREKYKLRNTALVRVEQLYPFPQKEIQAILAKYRNAEEVSWVQEEPRNRGAWTFMDQRLRAMLPDGRVCNYYGRDESASPATGNKHLHDEEEAQIITRALDLTPASAPQQAHLGSNGAGGNGSVGHGPLGSAGALGNGSGNGSATAPTPGAADVNPPAPMPVKPQATTGA